MSCLWFFFPRQQVITETKEITSVSAQEERSQYIDEENFNIMAYTKINELNIKRAANRRELRNTAIDLLSQLGYQADRHMNPGLYFTVECPDYAVKPDDCQLVSKLMTLEGRKEIAEAKQLKDNNKTEEEHIIEEVHSHENSIHDDIIKLREEIVELKNLIKTSIKN